MLYYIILGSLCSKNKNHWNSLIWVSFWVCCSPLLKHQRMAARAALLPANTVINFVTRYPSYFFFFFAPNASSKCTLTFKHTPTFPCPIFPRPVKEKNLARLCFDQQEHDRETGKEADGRKEAGKNGTVIITHLRTPFPHLIASHAGQTWQLFNFPKLNLISICLPLAETT